MLSNVKLTVLSENRVINPGLIAEQGLSILVETADQCILFDTGQTDAYIKNADALNIDLKCVQKIVLSHGHYDHAGGLPHIFKITKPIDVLCHPALTNKKYRVFPAGRTDIGVPWEKGRIKSKGAKFIFKTHPLEIAPNILISGEIPRNSVFEYVDETYQQRPLVSYIHDEIHDDMCLIINTIRGLIILLGCSHAGPVNSIMHAMRVARNKKIYAVMGGMHLQHSKEEKITKIVDHLIALNPYYLIPLHCTGLPAINKMIGALGNRVKLLNVGDCFELKDERKRRIKHKMPIRERRLLKHNT